MKYIKIDPRQPDSESVKQALSTLRAGGVIVYPTDTLYGLGVDVSNSKAMQRLFALKQRAHSNPISLLVDSLDRLEEYNELLPVDLHRQLSLLLPGKFTVILPNTIRGDYHLFPPMSKLKKIGWRIPDHPFIREVSRSFGKPISTTSANISGLGNVTSIAEVVSHFGDKLDLLIDAGAVKAMAGSTILDFTKKPLLMIREGEVSLEDTRKRLSGIEIHRRKTVFDIVFV